MCRAHALQNDLPCVLEIPPNLPPLDRSSTLSGFRSLCDMFFALRKTSLETNDIAGAIAAFDDELTRTAVPIHSYNDVEQADVGVTRHWMRLNTWRLAMAHLKMSTDPSGDISSMLFPLRATRDLLSDLSTMSMESTLR